MDEKLKSAPEQIVNDILERDAFTQWLGIDVIEVKKGFCKLRCTVRNDMLNGYQITHGGIFFSLADSAIAYAAASYGRLAVSIDHSISFTKKAGPGDVLTVTAKTISMGHKTGVIQAEIRNQNNHLVAVIKGTVYRTHKTFE